MGNSVTLDILAVDGASNILKNISGEFGALGAAATAALGLATGAFTSLLAAGSGAEDNMARFNSLVDSSPLAKMKGEMLNLADATAKKTRFDNDSIIAAEGQLAVYTSIGEKVFPDALKATVNLATYMQSDAPAAAKTLGRALEDIGNGSLSLLTKQKLLTKEQAETAKAMETNAGSSAAYKYELDNIPGAIQDQVLKLQEAGHMTEAYKLVWDSLGDSQKRTASEIRNANGDANAQTYVIDILNGKIGNLAEDMGKTFPGQIEILQNKLGDFWQEQGVKTENVLQPMIGWFNILADQAMPHVAEALDYMRGGLNKVVDTFGLLMNGQLTIGDIFKDIGKSAESIDWPGVGNEISNGLESAISDGIKAMGKGANIASGLLEKIKGNVESIDWQSLSVEFSNGIDSIDWTSMGSSSGKGVGVLAGWWQIQTNALGAAVSKTDWSKVFGSAQGAIDSFMNGLTSNMPTAWAAAVKVIVKDFVPFDGAIQDAIKLVEQLVSLLGQITAPTIGVGGASSTTSTPFKDPNTQLPGTTPSAVQPTPTIGGFSTGADFIVPPGYPNDTFPMRVESGEHVRVTKASDVSGSSQSVASPSSSGSIFHNHGTIHIHLSGDKSSVAGFMAELGASM